MIDRVKFLENFNTRGCDLAHDVLEPACIAEAKSKLTAAIEAEAAFHGGTDFVDYGMVLCCAIYDRIFINLFDNEKLMQPFEWILGDGCIVYAYTSSSMPPGKGNFSTRIHVDCPRLVPGYITNMGCTILLDDFSEDNGATWYLPGSHTRLSAPSEEEFASKAQRVVAPAGSVWYFNARLWHRGGTNQTDHWRHGVTINMGRPYMKQRLDIPQLLKDADLHGVSDRALQKLGFFSRPPTSLEEYYAPPEKRTFRQSYE